ncbi:MAG: tRNA (adenosine(37)-N6)-threonylcarbamoyltransferase complex dimerization subunit type 1 TsaB, partial [Rhodothermia bacterium]
MNLLLSIDTAGSACAVALSTPDDLLAVRVLREPRIHSAKLVPLIREVVEDAGFQTRDIDAVAVSKGPGSYTGLRIGVSTAKGLAFGLDIPLVGVATFEALGWANRAPGL